MAKTSEMDSLDSFVLITTSVFVRDPSFENTDVEQTKLTEKILARIKAALQDLDEVGMVGSWCFDHIGEEGTNARRCDQCKGWATDHTQPYLIPTLEWGSVASDGRFLCLFCQGILEDMQNPGLTIVFPTGFSGPFKLSAGATRDALRKYLFDYYIEVDANGNAAVSKGEFDLFPPLTRAEYVYADGTMIVVDGPVEGQAWVEARLEANQILGHVHSASIIPRANLED
jgi:hypothetical protein